MKSFFSLIVCLVIGNSMKAQDSTFFATNGIAIKGYDAVAYFTLHKAVAGIDSFSLSWSGVTWKFSSAENMAEFKKMPEAFAPQFGGYCAFGCSENHLAPTDPNAWTIINNKLYLNYNGAVKELWMKDTQGRIAKANQYWPNLRK